MNLTEAIKAAFGKEAEAEVTNQQQIWIGLHRTGKHVYAGTVSPAEVERRRRANKRAKAARRGQTRKLGHSTKTVTRRFRHQQSVWVRSNWANR